MNAITHSIAPVYVPQQQPVSQQQQIPQAALPPQGLVSCRTCSNPHRAEAKFCTHCGNATIVNVQQAVPEAESKPHPTPKFAHVKDVEIPKELLQELGDLLTLLIRERLSL